MHTLHVFECKPHLRECISKCSPIVPLTMYYCAQAFVSCLRYHKVGNVPLVTSLITGLPLALYPSSQTLALFMSLVHNTPIIIPVDK